MNKNSVSNLKNRIKDNLLKHKLLYLLLYVAKNRNNEKFMNKVFEPEKFFQITSYGEKIKIRIFIL